MSNKLEYTNPCVSNVHSSPRPSRPAVATAAAGSDGDCGALVLSGGVHSNEAVRNVRESLGRWIVTRFILSGAVGK